MPRCLYLTNYIDTKIKEVQGTKLNPNKGLRYHLGASIIGRPCLRELWYSFRWATRVQHGGQLLRLFDRGHEEEQRMTDWLEAGGAEVMRFQPGTRKQFRFKGVMGHFGGAMDAKTHCVPYQVEYLNVSFDTWILGEFKTHNDNSFKNLVAKDSVRESKPEHYSQAVLYADEHQLPGGLYGAVNKNTDELYWEFILPDPVHAEEMRQKASVVIHSRKPPPRISNSPSWYLCKFCDHRAACHFGAPLAKSCRTCVSSLPVEDGRWLCQRFNKLIPKDFEPLGCDYFTQIND